MSTNELTGKVRELKELKAMAEELSAAIKAIEDELKTYMDEQSAEELTVDVFKIRYQTITSARLDGAALKKAMPDLYRQFTRQTVSRRFSVA